MTLPSRKSPIKRSPVKRSSKPIPKFNAKAKAKRKIGYRKMLAGKEYKAARAEAMERAGNQCEQTLVPWTFPNSPCTIRCAATEGLHAHHLRYPKTRPLAAGDLKILCKSHHEEAESQKLGKARMF